MLLRTMAVDLTTNSSCSLHRRKPRVLLIVEGCNPNLTSVPLVGFSHANALRRVVDTLVVTHWRNKGDLVGVGWVEGKDFVAIDTEWASRWMWKFATLLRGGHGAGWTTLAALSIPLYYLFEQAVWRQFGRRLRNGEFDLVHRLVPLSPTTPSLLAAQCREVGVPFVVGPLNGGVPWPRGFDAARRKEREWLSYVRSAYKLLPGYRSVRWSASAILVGSTDTARQMPAACRPWCFYVPENAIDPERFDLTTPPERPAWRDASDRRRPVRAIFIGRLVPYKGADMLLEAAAPLVRAGSLTVEVVGDGPQMPLLRELVANLQLECGVTLSGWIDHRRLNASLTAADLFVFPSIREFGGGVVLEAMAAGVVPVVVNYGGPAELVTEETGYRIDLGRRDQIITALRDRLTDVVADPVGRIDAKRFAAQQRVKDLFTWEKKAMQVLAIYEWVLGQTLEKPPFDVPRRAAD